MNYLIIERKQINQHTAVVLSLSDGYYIVSSGINNPISGAYAETTYCKTTDIMALRLRMILVLRFTIMTSLERKVYKHWRKGLKWDKLLRFYSIKELDTAMKRVVLLHRSKHNY